MGTVGDRILAPEGWAIETQQLTRRYGSVVAVSALDLRVAYGVLFGLLGPNGAGKTTTIKMLTTLLPPDFGLGDGWRASTSSKAARRSGGTSATCRRCSRPTARSRRTRICCCPRGYTACHAERARASRTRSSSWGSRRSAHRLVSTFSGRHDPAAGDWRRRCCTGRQCCFSTSRRSASIPSRRHAVWDRLIDLQARYRTTILLTTHDMEEADGLCDELAIMQQGHVGRRAGPRRELKARVGRARHAGRRVLRICTGSQ